MYLATLRSAPRPVVAKLRSIAPRGFTSTATRRRPTRSWKSSAVRLSLAVGTLYYFTTSPVFAEAASQTIPTPIHPGDDLSKDPVTQKHIRIEANTETAYENDPESIENPKPQSGAQSGMATNDASDPEDKASKEFRSAFSYFMPSTHESKGMNCIDQLEVMQECLNKYPNVYGAKLADDAEDNPPPGVGDEQPGTSSFAMKAQSTTPIEAGAISEEQK